MAHTGAVTFLFTDIEGSTALWENHPDAMRVALARHDALMRDIIGNANGHVFKTVGDAFCAAFPTARDGVAAALRAQTALAAEPWPGKARIGVRMALHTGVVDLRDGDYFGPPVNRVARLLSAGHAGQTLMSQATCELCKDALPDAASVLDLGLHRLKDLAQPEQVYELQHPGLRDSFPPIKSLSTHPNNLPQQLTSFIGRRKEIADLGALLRTNRLLTLTGSGGCGKTRLSLEVAAESLTQFRDGAWFVELAPIADPGLVAKTVSAALRIAEEKARPLSETLVDQIKDKRLLLVLDNCEHVLAASATLVDALIRRCPEVRILASSREALGIVGEQIYRVPSLSLPDPKRSLTREILDTFEAAQLFVDRAKRVRPDFGVTSQTVPALASVCGRLDGIPLALELAAARVGTLSLEEINGKLDQRFSLLTRGSRTALPRQQTLRAMVDWSYELLNTSEQQLLQRLSIFAGGWTEEAAVHICNGDPVASEGIVDLLSSLANKSLVVWSEVESQSRYRLLETIRHYAREKLRESGDEEELRQRHRDYYLALAEELAPKLSGAEQAKWLQQLEQEQDNLRSALEWSLTAARAQGGLRLCGALQRYWGTRGHFSEGRGWCERMLAEEGQQPKTPERAKALHAAGFLAHYQGDYSVARARYEESLAIREEVGDRAGVNAILNNLGNIAIELGDYVSARAMLEQSLVIARELGDPLAIANALGNLGVVADKEEDYQTAVPLYEEALAIRRRMGDRLSIAISLNNLGNIAFEQQDMATARRLHEEGLAIRRELGDRRGIALSLGNLAHLAFEQRDLAAGQALAAESLSIARDLGDMRQVAYMLEGLAAVAAALGNSRHAAGIWGAAVRLREAIGTPLSGFGISYRDESIATARAGLGDDAFDRAWQEGRALSVDQAIAFALGQG